MKSVCIISLCNIYLLPYAKNYIKNSENIKYYLLFWDREGLHGKKDNFNNCDKIVFNYRVNQYDSKIKKILGYIKAIRFINKILKKNNFDNLVFLQTQSAVCIKKRTINKYKKRYIIDIRDYSFEKYTLYYNKEASVIINSYKTVISSFGYKDFLPPGDYVIAHNYNSLLPEEIEFIRNKKNNFTGPIRISFIGSVRFYDIDKKLLNIFANDNRFQINYYGKGSEYLMNYCIENNIKNVDFHGSFSPIETVNFYAKTDIINNIYGNNSPYYDYALSNKLYYAAQLKFPIFVCEGTYMEKISNEIGLGFVFSFNDSNIKDDFLEWYNNLDFDYINKKAEMFLKKVIEENKIYLEMIDIFLNRQD